MSRHYYLVIAYRSGCIDKYHFPVGIYESRDLAQEAASSHHEYRGYKYAHMIYELAINQSYDAGEAEVIDNPKMKESCV